MEKKKVIIDCDPGIDDSLAIILALKSPELEVRGITIVSGNVHGNKGAENALKILKSINRLDVPVYVGKTEPLKRQLVTAEDTHGEDGLGETQYPTVEETRYRTGAVEFILNAIKKEEISIIALGPLTNIATAMQEDNEVFSKVKEIVFMGGAFKSFGNCSPVAEFNFWVDPDAAKYVLNNAKVPLTMVGLDVTREIVLTPNYIEMLKQFNNQLSKLIVDITRFYVNFHWKQEKTLGCVINDPLAVAYLLDNSLCEGKSYYVDVVIEGQAIGMSMVDEGNFLRKKPNCKVLTETDANRFFYKFFNTLFPEFKEDIEIVLSDKRYSY
ncbi:nucleoside hydrolase [Clostridium bovifaecis]|uniref:Nucleoside hydrolase n=1 Tax=Clostridium bovifaecis TaxID=2184719 RepID=A0A6I6F2G5_9CLOT|nr:nucleoside hydrolase [Clostridium bovifaecis]